MILIYICCSSEDRLKEAIFTSCKLMEKGFSIFMSHGQPSKLTILERCDCLYSLDVEPEVEVDVARDHNIPIFRDINKLLKFFEEDVDAD